MKVWLEINIWKKPEELYSLCFFIWKHFKRNRSESAYTEVVQVKNSVLFMNRQIREKGLYKNLKLYKIKCSKNVCAVHCSKLLCMTQRLCLYKPKRKIKIPFFNQFELAFRSFILLIFPSWSIMSFDYKM